MMKVSSWLSEAVKFALVWAWGVGKDRRGDLVTIPIDASYLSDLTTGEERE